MQIAKNKLVTTVTLAAAVLTVACGEEPLRDVYQGYTPHERYVAGLREAGISQTALGRDWIAAAGQAIRGAVAINAPYEEVSYLNPQTVRAMGYRLALKRGQTVAASLELESDSSYRVFLDLFVVPHGSSQNPILLISADSLDNELDWVARRDGDYIVRIQPELLRGGRYAVTVAVGASLAFPVANVDTTAVLSGFGAPRAAGRRNHHGVDIFAPRGTPVLAAAAGRIIRVEETRLGGKVVWQRDDMGRALYYAHLHEQFVERGFEVQVGDTIGLVGNSGNARTTPPHLHFGVYTRGTGAWDPYPALYEPPTYVQAFAGDSSLIGDWGRAARNRTRVRQAPTALAPVLAELPLHTRMQIEAGTGDWYRVALPDGSTGFVAARLAEAADLPIGSALLASASPLRTRPEHSASQLGSLAAGQEVAVLGRFGEFLYVEGPNGQSGWLTSY